MKSAEVPASDAKFEEIVKQSWMNYLDKLPCLLARMSCLRLLYHPSSGQYSHYSLTMLLGAENTDCFLADVHQRVFREWLAMPLEEKIRDLSEYLQAVGGKRSEALERITDNLHERIIPASASQGERELFTTDLLFGAGLLLAEPRRRPAGLGIPVLAN